MSTAYGAGEHALVIAGPAGSVQAALTVPASVSAEDAVAVVCHPHPLFGGSMDNKVVVTLARVYRDRGLCVLRFNFRGVGGSAGKHDNAVGEVDDLLAVLAYAQAELGARRVELAGFSFGSYVAAAGSGRLPPGLRLEHLVLVAPPVHHYPFAGLPLPPQVLVVQGEDDEVVPPAQVFAWVAALVPAPQLVRFSGCGHFFHGRLSELKTVVSNYLLS